jgi:hypothetical protein
MEHADRADSQPPINEECTMIEASLIVIIIALGAILALLWRQRPRMLEAVPMVGQIEPPEPEGLVKQTVIVHGKDGTSLRGVLLAEHADRLTLVQAFYLDGPAEHPVDGLAHVLRPNVAWVQSDLTLNDPNNSQST